MSLAGITTAGQKGTQKQWHPSKSSKTGASPSDEVLCYTKDTPFRAGDFPLGRGFSQCIPALLQFLSVCLLTVI